MRPLILLCLALVSCSEYTDALLPTCLWADVGAVDSVPEADGPTDELACLRVRAPENARVSAEPLYRCEAPYLGTDVVTVPAGEPVYRYSYPDPTPEQFRAAWVACPAGAE